MAVEPSKLSSPRGVPPVRASTAALFQRAWICWATAFTRPCAGSRNVQSRATLAFVHLIVTPCTVQGSHRHAKHPLFVVPVDFSPEMERGVVAAFALAKRLDAEVHLLEVVPRRGRSLLEDEANPQVGIPSNEP